jgi:tetratricopeptide (TPR) repeat protein/DNA-binding SARP family transcriptional activator
VEFKILGPTALEVDGKRIPLGAAKQRGMLALLLCHVREPVRVDLLIEQLWDGQRSPDRRAGLYALASRIRAIFNEVGIPNALVRLSGVGAYRLDLDPALIDFHRFRRMLVDARQAARQGHHDTAAGILAEAIALWQGEPVADLRGAQSEHLRSHMNDALLDAHRLLADSQLRIGQYHSVLARLEPVVLANDLDEGLAQHWITALCAAGQAEVARTFYLAFRRRFRKEMRTEPTIHLPGQIGKAQTTSQVAALGPSQLPKDIHDFTGHDQLLRELDHLTDPDHAGESAVAIIGMPGVGKTTLVTYWAHRRRHRFPHGQLFLNCQAYGPSPPIEPVDALGRFLHALGVPPDRIPPGEEQRRDRLNQLLAGRRVLIVLDNIGDSDRARRLLPTPKSCVTLFTSRNRLKGLTIREGVRNITIPPLPYGECLTLLRQIIGQRRADRELEAVQMLAKLSSGLPLAVRIIGEHVAERPLAGIADLVDELRDRVLSAGSEDDEEASLQSAFAWSYEALDPNAARLFRLLGLSPGSSISPEAAASMLGTAAVEAEQLLNRLAKAHLVGHDTARRYTLHDLLRRYAKDRADLEESAEDRLDAMRRLLDWYLLSAASAARLLVPDRPPVPDLPDPAGHPLTFASEQDAMKWSVAERGNLAAVTRWAAKNTFHRHGWQIPGAVHEIFERYGRQHDMLEIHQIALASARADHHQIAQLGTLNNLGVSYFAVHDYRNAAESFEAGLELAREMDYAEVEASCSHNLASVYLRTGELARAVGIYRQVLDKCRDMANSFGEASTLHRLGEALAKMKQYDEAFECYRQALAIREQLGSLRGQGKTHGDLAALYLETGQKDLAFDHCRRALDIHHKTGDEAAFCDAVITMSEIERALRMYPASIKHCRRAISISQEIADSRRYCRALVGLAATLFELGRSTPSFRLCVEARDTLSDLPQVDAQPLLERIQTMFEPTAGAVDSGA